MKHLIISLLISFSAGALSAQTPFTKQLTQQKSGEGKVILIQDEEIDEIVNSSKRDDTRKQTDKSPRNTPADKGKQSEKGTPNDRTARETGEGGGAYSSHRIRAIGYRIQVFTGSNSHQDKMRAQAIGEKCKKAFPMLSAYPRFISPRWICRVGDFKTREDALEYAAKIRAARIADEVHVVRCEVLLRSRD